MSEAAAAAAPKSLRSCPTLCDPIDGSPPGSPVPGILQARTLEWVAISVCNAWKWKVKVKSLSRVRLLVTPWTAAYQAPPSMGFSRQEYRSGSPVHVGNFIYDFSAFSKSKLNVWKLSVHVLLKPSWENFQCYFSSVWNECNCVVSLNILWYYLSLGLEWKLTFSIPVATAEFSKFAGILNAPLSQHHLSGYEIAHLFYVCFHFSWVYSYGIAQSYGNSILNLLGKCQIIFQRGHTF